MLLQPSFDISTASAAKIREWEKHTGSLFRVEHELIEAGFSIRKLSGYMNLLDQWLSLWSHLQRIEMTMD